MTQENLKLNLHYISIQMPYWMGYAVLVSFASVFLLSRNFSNSQIGMILSAGNLLAAVLQPFVASFADRMKNFTLSQLAMLMAVFIVIFSVALIWISRKFWMIAVIYILLYTSLMLLQPMTIAIGTFFISRGYPLYFGVARGIGSLAFAAASTVTGFLVERYGANMVLYLLIIIFLVLAGAALFIDTREVGGKYSVSLLGEKNSRNCEGGEEPCSLPIFLGKYKRFMLLLVGVALIFTFHNMVNSYLYQIIKPLGGTEADMGNSLSIAAVSELPTMFLLTWLMKHFKCKTLMRTASVFFTVKAVILLCAGNMLFVNIAQSLQILGFALHTAVSVYYTSRIIPKKDLVKGQTLMTTANIIGGIVGTFIGGQMLNFFSVHFMLLIGTLISAVGTVIVCVAAED